MPRQKKKSDRLEVTIEDAQIILRNFAGKATQYNKLGDRNFGTILTDEVAQQMVRDVMTVVLRRVTDPETLLALAGDFRILQEKIMSGGDGSGSGTNNAAVVGFGESPATFDEIEVQ